MSPDNSEARVTVWFSEEMKDDVDDNYVDWQHSSRSEWLRDAAQTRMAIEDALAVTGVDLPDQPDERADLIEKIVKAGVVAADLEAE